MPRYPSGLPVVLDTEVREPTVNGVQGALINPTAITLELAKPDGTVSVYSTVTSPAITTSGTGLFSINLGTALPTGPYQWAWVTTGTAAGATRGPGVFHVDARLATSHVDYTDVLERLELTTATLTAAKRAELQDMLAAAISEQAQYVGAVAPRTVTETVTASGGRLALSTRPVLSPITSALYGGVSASVSTWSVPSAMAGIIESSTTYLTGTYTVTFVAGRNPVPQDLVEAALLRVQHSYESQRGAADTAFSDQTEGSGGSAFLLLLRAQDKEKPYNLPSVA